MFNKHHTLLLPVAAVLLGVFATVAGCSVQKANIIKAELMPPEVAQKVFEKYGFKSWVQNPEASCLMGKTVKPALREFNLAIYNMTSGYLRLVPSAYIGPFCSPEARFKVDSQKTAEELVNAAISLGATMKNIVVSAAF